MKSSPFGFGIVGTGMIAGFHARAIARVEGARLVGVAGRRQDTAAGFARIHAIPFATESLAELLALPELDGVCITTPSGAHLEPALAAIRAGKHVVIEKPLEITMERIDRIIAAADEHGVLIAPIFQARFGEGARTVKAALDAGRLGRLVLCSAYVKWHRPDSYYSGWKGVLSLDGGGAVMSQAIHAVDLLQWFAGLPEQVFAWTTRRVHTRIESEDTACAALKFPSGALGVIEASTASWPGWARRVEITGEAGSVALEDDRIARWDFAQAEPGDAEVRRAHAGSGTASGAGIPSAIPLEGHIRQLQDLVDALGAGRSLALDGREGRKAVSVVTALYRSAALETPVELF